MIEKLLKALVVVVILVIIAVSIWAWVAAPCSWYRYSHVKDIPGRCIVWVQK